MKKQTLLSLSQKYPAVILAEISATRGSTPREEGAFMVIASNGSFKGSIGGGALEWRALAEAQAMLSHGEDARLIRQSLGPDLGQCCGGAVDLRLTRFTHNMAVNLPDDDDFRRPLLIFGAGHVGRALVMALAPLPFAIRWIDSRAEQFPRHLPAQIEAINTDPEAEMANAPENAFVLILTHSHALDLALTAKGLKNKQISYLGLIGSETKKARFFSRLRQMGFGDDELARICSPIGLAGIRSKKPEAIAASVAADLLIRDEQLKIAGKALTAENSSA